MNDVLFVYAKIKDANSTTIPENNVSVSFSISGDAEIVSPTTISTEAGIATALIKIGTQTAPIKIKAISGELISNELEITFE